MTIAIMILTVLAAEKDYVATVTAWRQEREKSLQGPYGWLSAVGLDLIEEGLNPIGCAKNAVVKLPMGLPEHAGDFLVAKDEVFFVPDSRVPAIINEKPIREKTNIEWKNDNKAVKLIIADRVGLQVLPRSLGPGARVRVWDPEAEARKKFKGLIWYSVQPSYRVNAHFIADSNVAEIHVANSVGSENAINRVGILEFTFKKKPVRLIAFEGDEGGLFLVFRDQTSGKTTYGAARYLYTDKPDTQGNVMIDFNRAYSPPCAFTHYATCPLPPSENILSIAIEAGEQHKH